MAAPGRRKRGSVAGLPPSDDGCKRLLPGIAVLPEPTVLPEFAALPELAVLPVLAVLPALATLPKAGAGVCAWLGRGNNNAIVAATARETAFGARQRRLRGDFLASSARTSATVRITSEVAKANHRQEAMPACHLFPCRNRAISRRGPPNWPRWLTELERIWLTR